ncbi:superoxide dismutase [Stylonychia lemnae]|uniref:Superoxide dismutase n=1 Tax=Stylonychia lemnae TaxID=5949 RepID=A0A078AVN6_STYLE|nr:superoxide dismutase [Stylonychia lemnae]|eukprot:CDW86249.1 superoxide dismutase [Stylonychia lemnae]
MLAKAFQGNRLRLLNQSQRLFSAKAVHEPLPWEINSLEPVLSGYLLDHHYNRHHKLYVTKFNETVDQLEEAQSKNDVAQISKLGQNLKFFGGGNYNHTFFWESLAPTKLGGGNLPGADSVLTKHINQTWGSYDKFIANFSAQTASIQGSGWGWLVYHKGSKTLQYRPSYNQDLITDYQGDLVPLMNIDVWEHAWYLDYKHVKADYLKEIWKVINWDRVEKRLIAAQKA